MKNEDVKKEYAKVIRNAKITAGLFFILFTPSLVITVKELDQIMGLSKDTWLNASIAGFVIYIGFVFLIEGDSDSIKVKSELKSGELFTLEECNQYYDLLESWSQIIVDYFKSN